MLRSVFIHDDDCWQIELLPLAAWESCERDLREIRAFLRDNPDDSGEWREIYSPKPLPHSFSEFGLTLRSMHALLGRNFTRSNRVTTGDSAQVFPLIGATAFSADGAPVFFAHRTAKGLVGAVWVEPSVHGVKSEAALAEALARLGRVHRLLIVDRKHGRLFDLSNPALVDDYIRSRSDRT